MPVTENRPYLLNPAKVDQNTLNPRDVFNWYKALSESLSLSSAMLNMQDAEDRSKRLFIVNNDGTSTFINEIGTGPQAEQVRREIYTAAMTGRLMCYPIGESRPIQICTDGKKNFSLSRPWETPQIEEPKKPGSLGFFKSILYNIFGFFREEKEALDRSWNEYHQVQEQIQHASLIGQVTRDLQASRGEATLNREKGQIGERKVIQAEQERAIKARQKVESIENAAYIWTPSKRRMRPEFTESIGDRTIVKAVDAEIYIETEEYKRRLANEKKAEKKGDVLSQENSLAQNWYMDCYLEVDPSNLALLSILACGAMNMKQINDPVWQENPDVAGTRMFENLLNTFQMGEGAIFSEQQNEYMFMGRAKAVSAINRAAGNTVFAPDGQELADLIIGGLNRMCQLTLNSGEYDEKEAARISFIKDVLDMVQYSKSLSSIVKNHELAETVLTEARGKVRMGEILTNGYKARAELYKAAVENTSLGNVDTIVAKIQAMHIVQTDLYHHKAEREEVLSDIADARAVDDEALAISLEDKLKYHSTTDLQKALGKNPESSVQNIYTKLKEHPDNKKLLEKAPKELINELMKPMQDSRLRDQAMAAIKPVQNVEKENLQKENKQDNVDIPKFDENEILEVLRLG